MYLYVEKVVSNSDIETDLYKVDRSGNILNIISLPYLGSGDRLSGGKVRPFASVNWENGDIWKVTLGKDKVFIDRWSLIY